jgi:ectoine hydroxylase-related dioxygenase (phytanoyl-CoA dioxygenase family)
METHMPEYLAGRTASDEQIAAWVEQFHRDGYLFIPSVLPPDWVSELRADLDRELSANGEEGDGIIQLHHRMFETSAANLRLFDLEPIVTFAETLIATTTHVVHNNSFRTPLGKGITTWHQDDPPHLLVTEGAAPKNIRLPVLLFTANYYLTDVPTTEYGPTQVIPGSHLFGASPPPTVEGTEWEDRIVSCCGPAGSVVMFNCQAWHRGGPNLSDRVRYMAQCSYGRRSTNHFFYPFMNYVMPAHCYEAANSRLKRLLGFLPSGAYG